MEDNQNANVEPTGEELPAASTETTQPTDEQAVVATAPEEVIPGELVEAEAPEEPEEEDLSDDDFFAEPAVANMPQVDPTKVITLLPSSAPDKVVEVDGPIPLATLIGKSGLQFAGDFECFLNGAKLSMTDIVPNGASVVIAGKVKGG